MFSRSNSNKLLRSISVVDYMLEGDGHTVAEAAKEFNCSISTIRRDINFLGIIAFYSIESDGFYYDLDERELKKLKIKYLKVKKLAEPTKTSNTKNIKKRNTKKATSK